MFAVKFRMMGWLVRATSTETSESSSIGERERVGEAPGVCIGNEQFGGSCCGSIVVAGDDGCHWNDC